MRGTYCLYGGQLHPGCPRYQCIANGYARIVRGWGQLAPLSHTIRAMRRIWGY